MSYRCGFVGVSGLAVRTGRLLLTLIVALWAGTVARGDSNWLYGIHWWGYTSGQPTDNNPATMLDCPTYGGWDVETVMTHSASWWAPSYFVGLYQDLYNSRNVTPITRIDYTWGQTVPAPSNPDYAGWPNACVSAVNALRSYSHIWIIGNEPNIVGEGTGWPDSQVTPAGYATIYRNVRNAIHSSANPSPAGEHIVLIAPPSPGGVIPGVRWMDGNQWLGQVIDNIPSAEIDGIGMHSYGGSVADFHNTYVSQLSLIDSKGLQNRPVYITEWNKVSSEAAMAQFVRDSYADLNTWNQTPGNHNIRCLCWFVYDADQQAGGGWNSFSIEYWRNNGEPLGSYNDLFTAFEQTVDLRYPAGVVGTPSGGMIDAVPSGSNLSLTATQVATDSNYSGSYGGDKAIDGIVSAASKWTSAGTSPPHWLKLDLGQDCTVNGYIVRHAGAAGEPTSYNTETFAIQSSTSYTGPWSDETSVNNSSQQNVTNRTYVTPKTLRYVRLYITDAGIDNYARIPEFEVRGQATALPTITLNPTSLSPVTTQGSSPPAGSFTVQNTGQGTLNYSITDNVDWLSVDPPSGSCTTETDTITIIYATQDEPEGGPYQATITVSAPGASNTPQYVTVTLTVLPSPYAPADFEPDGDVDGTDLNHLQDCLAGSHVDPPEGCDDADLDDDGDVDLSDFGVFQFCLSGSGLSADPNCAD